MRLIVTILWSIAALCWLPWAFVLLRLLVDIATGTALMESRFLPFLVQGLWPRWQILGPWYIHSWFPVSAFLGCAMTAVGWRIYWVNEGYRLTRPVARVVISILVPPYAVWLMYDDSRIRHISHEEELQQETEDARLRIDART